MVQQSIKTALLSRNDRFEESLESAVLSYGSSSTFFSSLFLLLAQLQLPEEKAKTLYFEIRDYQNKLAQTQGRPVDFRVAMMDYLVNVEPLVNFPKVIELAEFEKQHHYAVFDSLTGIYNRRYIDALLTQELYRAKRHHSEFTLIFMDIDDFKQINDSLGHLTGDKVLQTLGSLLKNLVRTEDTLARYGGEEFICLLPETGKDGGRIFAQRIVNAIHQLVPGEIPRFTVSMGVAIFPDDGATVEALVENADSRLYAAKAAGKDRFVAG